MEKKDEKPEETKPELPAKEEKKAEKKEAVLKDSEAKESSTGLVPLDIYLAAGVHIGTQRKLNDMKKFIYKVRADGLSVLDIGTIDKRIGIVANFLAQYTPEKIVVVCARDVGKRPAKKFAEMIGATPIITRFMPGSLTNPDYEKYFEPEVMFVADPGADKQAVLEALKMNMPIVALCDTNNMTQHLDVILPVNNKGKKSLALVYWLLAREVLKKQGKIKKDDEFKVKVEDFEGEESAPRRAPPSKEPSRDSRRGSRR
ncbi:MAG: 30S ribosomal protein S2 [archaeon]